MAAAGVITHRDFVRRLTTPYLSADLTLGV